MATTVDLYTKRTNEYVGSRTFLTDDGSATEIQDWLDAQRHVYAHARQSTPEETKKAKRRAVNLTPAARERGE